MWAWHPASHQPKDRQQRDELVEAVFAAAGLPLVRVAGSHWRVASVKSG
ncbi:MAG: DUF2726 domain-containing protein [Planctomycetales bacterium]|nr:DUF2726 domain-containing protein [Planctomycetales bacterium]